MQVTKKSSPGHPQKKIFINLIEFLKQSLHLKNYSNNTFFGWKTREEKKRKFVRINVLVEILFVCVVFFFFFETIYILILIRHIGGGRRA